jgi:hypothetical protein
MAIEILRKKQQELRTMARFYNRRCADGRLSVRTLNLLRECAKLTIAIVVLSHR